MRYTVVAELDETGKPGRCRIIDAETGVHVPGIISASIEIGPDKGYRPILTLRLDAALDIEVDEVVIERVTRE